MLDRDHELALDDAELLARCEVHLFRASGPGGQHRNKVSSAVRLHHHASGLRATASDSRSQQQNRHLALRRLRMKLACDLRRPAPLTEVPIPRVVQECIVAPRAANAGVRPRLDVGRKDRRFWAIAAFLLDVLESASGRIGEAARRLGVTTGSLVRALRSDRHLLGTAQRIRKQHGLRPLA